ncbi:hypothetical protein [Paracoccus sp. T5]|uniref:hypothetical protein n=1 Tax=Paracoccus sp. T5 TaxID=3402161 RepID=UPI003ADB5D44
MIRKSAGEESGDEALRYGGAIITSFPAFLAGLQAEGFFRLLRVPNQFRQMGATLAPRGGSASATTMLQLQQPGLSGT